MSYLLFLRTSLSKIVLSCISAFIFVSCSTGGNGSTSAPVVNTNLGIIQGVPSQNSYPGVNEYKGIPYAQPLTAQDRWTLARPVSAWSGILNASQFGGACPQEHRFDLTDESLTEDCLTLNVTTPQNIGVNEKLPVMIWIPGGAFVGGSSNLYRLDKLAREGRIIVVSINYRVGALGFMAHPSISEGWNGNLGLEDQRLAMQWVKDNIGAFGGDSAKITVAGESAGAASTCLHLLSNTKTAGLFQQAMPLSYNCLYEWPTRARALTRSNFALDFNPIPIYQQMAIQLGCTETGAAQLTCMRNKDIKELLNAQGAVSRNVPLFPFGPVIDNGPNGTLPLQDYSSASISANINKVPMLYGAAQDELRLWVAYDVIEAQEQPEKYPGFDARNVPQNFIDFEYLQYYLMDPSPSPPDWASMKSAIINAYFPSGQVTASGLGSMFSDYTPSVGLSNCTYLRTASAFSAVMPLYQWEFADPNAPVLGVGIAKGAVPLNMDLGPLHSSALNYIFPNLSNTSAIDAPDLPADSQSLANKMVQVWANFVKFGTPTTTDVPVWPRFNATSDQKNVMKFKPTSIATDDANTTHRCDFWRGMDSKLNPITIN